MNAGRELKSELRYSFRFSFVLRKTKGRLRLTEYGQRKGRTPAFSEGVRPVKSIV
jgi:hypothetical protein